ncbi:hypothetical protein [Massilia sp. CF038]|uniref:hypothetical protein n=1 Tax=Massilia sp. CF038 TaxID=1881045 RepID=UPI00091C0303|nr:hypothetical protein [Massilia sp. CF038]SHH46812.1 hypothetical protein SAMN05428948_4163 [Massilia sp. CF038]
MKIRNFVFASILAMLFCLPAQAKGFLLFNTGSELFEVAPFPAEMVSEYRDLNSYKAGYKCDHFGLFWADIWTWNCSLVAVSAQDSYADLPAAVASKLRGDPAYAFKNTQRSFWNHYGILAALAALGGLSFLRRFI